MATAIARLHKNISPHIGLLGMRCSFPGLTPLDRVRFKMAHTNHQYKRAIKLMTLAHNTACPTCGGMRSFCTIRYRDAWGRWSIQARQCHCKRETFNAIRED